MSVIFIVAVFTVFTDITAYFIYYKLLCGSLRIIIQIGKSAFGYHFFGYVFHPLPLSLFLFELTVRLAFQTAALLYLVDPPQWITDNRDYRICKISRSNLSCRKDLSFHRARCLRKQPHTPY